MEPDMSIETITKPKQIASKPSMSFKPKTAKPKKGFKPKNGTSTVRKTVNKNAKVVKPILPLYCFTSLELSSKKLSAAIIKINQLVGDGISCAPASALFSNNGKEISEEAFNYHKISADMLSDKPVAADFNFNKTQFLVFWDGEVARHLLRTNKVKKYAPIINLHTLARYLKDPAKPIKLVNYAKEVLPQKRLQLEIKMRNPNSKIDVLPDILAHIQSKYLDKYGDNSPRFLSVLSRAKSRQDFEERLNKFLEIKKVLDERASKSNKGKTQTQDVKADATTPAKRVINVTLNTGNGNKNSYNTIKVAVIRKK